MNKYIKLLSYSASAAATTMILGYSASSFAAPPPATPPTITILSPSDSTTLNLTQTQLDAGYPVDIQFSIGTPDSKELKDVQVLDVRVNENTIINGGNPIGNPFTNSNTCSGSMVLANGISSCSVSETTSATAAARWNITEIGTYAISVSAKITGDTGEDDVDVYVALLNVEYPAPPAEANKYIKATYPKLAAGCRGTIISEIANNHAQVSKYGPKGGPYDIDKIKTDVDEGLQNACS